MNVMEMIRLNDTVEFRGFRKKQQRHILSGGTLITEGVKYLADRYGCYWLLNEIANLQDFLAEYFLQIWRIKRVSEGSNSFQVTVYDGEELLLHDFEIIRDDFMAGEVEVWCILGEIMLPSEY